LGARLRYTRLRHQASVEDVDYRAARDLDRSLFHAMIAGHWIGDAQNLIIEGPADVGKGWLACAIGQKARRDNTPGRHQSECPADIIGIRTPYFQNKSSPPALMTSAP
jgi:DNA replication protein DnaC